MYQVGIVTLSDKGAKGERQDLSGPKIQELLPKDKYEVISYTMLPDDREKIRRELIRLSDEVKCDLILTTGGTGFSPRDITPVIVAGTATDAPLKVPDSSMFS